MSQIYGKYDRSDTDEFPSVDFRLDPDEVWAWTHGSN